MKQKAKRYPINPNKKPFPSGYSQNPEFQQAVAKVLAYDSKACDYRCHHKCTAIAGKDFQDHVDMLLAKGDTFPEAWINLAKLI